jgi:hypothetical protein
MEKVDKDQSVSRPKVALHANSYPREGFSLLVDGKFKTHYATRGEAESAAATLKSRFPLLQIAVRDAVTAERSLVELPIP